MRLPIKDHFASMWDFGSGTRQLNRLSAESCNRLLHAIGGGQNSWATFSRSILAKAISNFSKVSRGPHTGYKHAKWLHFNKNGLDAQQILMISIIQGAVLILECSYSTKKKVFEQPPAKPGADTVFA